MASASCSSSRAGGQQIWLADFDAATGATSNPRKLTDDRHRSRQRQVVARRPIDRVHFGRLSRLPGNHDGRFDTGNKCNADRDEAAAASKVKAQIFTHLMYRHWNHFTGDKRSHLFLVTVDSGAMRDLNPGDTHDVPPFSLEGGCGFAISPDSKELAFTEKLDPDERSQPTPTSSPSTSPIPPQSR